MALETYNRKRNFKKTAEPPGKAAKPHSKPIFVIQEHHATRLHYDFRLEADGVLKSWAVTKEPTLDPSVKRLAVEVEDHPLAYATFSGDIPEGQYGAGHVEIWDHGTYDTVMSTKPDPQTIVEGIEEGRIEVDLHGKKLNGKFALVLFKEEGGRRNWLLIKMKDQYARPGSAADEKGSSSSKKGGAKKSGAKKTSSAETNGKTNGAVKVTKPARSKKSGSAEEVEFTNVDKIMFPEEGITKGEVLDYYLRIADHILPHLKDRPITVERFPDGLAEGGPRFWQKNTPEHYPDWIPRVELAAGDETVQYALVNDARTLLYLVNQGALVFHVWMSRIQNLDRPDYVLFDLDPGERPFKDVLTVAKALHRVLDAEGIESVPKTSGKSGLHVLAPWKKRGDDDAARAWAMEIAERVVEELPEIATVERSRAERGGRLYLDVIQNVRGRHAVAPYTLRPTPIATVSTPLDWREVTARLDPKKYSLRTIFKRMSRLSSDPGEKLLEFYRKRR